MAKQTINIGSSANDGSGDPLRTAFDKVNDNFGELYAVSGAGSGQNIAISGQKIISENTNGNIQLDPNGTGEIVFLGNTSHGDSIKAQFGDADDLQIYHDGSNSYIVDAGTGNLNLQADNNINILNNAGTEFKAQFITNGAVNLFYDNSAKLATSAAGGTLTGVWVQTANIAADAITGAKIADDAIDSEHYAADSIDEEHIANDAVGSAELKTLSTLLIKNSSGSTLKTVHGAGA